VYKQAFKDKIINSVLSGKYRVDLKRKKKVALTVKHKDSDLLFDPHSKFGSIVNNPK